MMDSVKEAFSDLGEGTSHLAHRVGRETASIARRVGPRRGLLGLVLLGAAVGGTIYLVRYLRARSAASAAAGTATHAASATAGRDGIHARAKPSDLAAPQTS